MMRNGKFVALLLLALCGTQAAYGAHSSKKVFTVPLERRTVPNQGV